MGQVIVGDCLDVLKTLSNDYVGLVYLDPPFFTQKTHKLKSRDLKQAYRFDDKWEDLGEYINFLKERLIEIKRVMKDDACIFFHCDKTASHHIRYLLDDIFAADNFLSEIIWIYKRWSNQKRALLNTHQTIYMYSKTRHYTFNQLFQDYSPTTNLDQILQKRERNSAGKTVYARLENGEPVLGEPKKGVPLSDTWFIPFLNPKAGERAGYPTQKPVLLLERVISLASNPGDIVLDPFCGSGTTLVAASLLNRDYIGIDISKKAVELTCSRLENPTKSKSDLLNKGYTAYENLPEHVEAVLTNLPVKLVQRNSGVDAIHNEFLEGSPIAIRIQRQNERLSDAANKLRKAGKKMRAKLLILIQTMPENQKTWLDVMPEDVKVIQSVDLLIAAILENFNSQ